MEDQEYKLKIEANFSSETLGPPDSHEAMNNRELIREKRTYKFLMGLINNNSRFEVTNVDQPLPMQTRKSKEEIAANEVLLELMVKIAADPQQWEKVHSLLQKIDEDLITSKKMYDQVHNLINSENDKLSTTQRTTTPNLNQEKVFFENEKSDVKESPSVSKKPEIKILTQENVKSIDDKIKSANMVFERMENQNQLRSHTKTALKTNNWPQFTPEPRIIYKPESKPINQNPSLSKYPWLNENKSGSKTYPRNFAYHRVTGHPLYHTSLDKNPKAYIAVSVIAPKQLISRPQDENLILENELRQLKPWTHKQNLKNMAAIRSRWVIQSDNDNKDTTAS